MPICLYKFISSLLAEVYFDSFLSESSFVGFDSDFIEELQLVKSVETTKKDIDKIFVLKDFFNFLKRLLFMKMFLPKPYKRFFKCKLRLSYPQ